LSFFFPLIAEDLEGKLVIGFNGWKIGKVKQLVLDTSTWRITHLDVALVGNIAEELGVKEVFRTARILIAVERIQGIGDTITLNTSKEDLLDKLTTVEAGIQTDATATVPPATGT
jgi:sporulation protein YlmC with PRC-barrel domain